MDLLRELDDADDRLNDRNAVLQGLIVSKQVTTYEDRINNNVRTFMSTKRYEKGFGLIEKRNSLMKSALSLTRNEDTSESDGENTYVCRFLKTENELTVCGKEFNFKSNRNRHEKDVHKGQNKFF